MHVTKARVLLLGARGQLGQRLCAEAQAQGWSLLAWDRRALDIRDPVALRRQIGACAPDVIINAAGFTQVDLAEQAVDTAFAVNATAPAHLARVAQAVGAILIHLSTDYVFDGRKGAPYTETDAPNPLGVYGASKLAGEQAVQAYCARHLIVRTAWLFDPLGPNFVRTLLRLAATQTSVRIVADQRGAPTRGQDLARALLHMARQALQPGFADWGLYHFAGRPQISWFEFAQAIVTAAWQQGLLAGKPALVPISSAEYVCAARRPLDSRLDCSKIAAHFAIEPSDWQPGLQDLRPFLPPVQPD